MTKSIVPMSVALNFDRTYTFTYSSLLFHVNQSRVKFGVTTCWLAQQQVAAKFRIRKIYRFTRKAVLSKTK